MSWKWQEKVEDFTGLPPRVQILSLTIIAVFVFLSVHKGVPVLIKKSGGPIWPPPAVEQAGVE